jgi:hypothetical protein
LGSLAISPLLWVVGTSAPIIEGIDLENSSGFDPLETEDDFFLLPAMALTIAGSIFSICFFIANFPSSKINPT